MAKSQTVVENSMRRSPACTAIILLAATFGTPLTAAPPSAGKPQSATSAEWMVTQRTHACAIERTGAAASLAGLSTYSRPFRGGAQIIAELPSGGPEGLSIMRQAPGALQAGGKTAPVRASLVVTIGPRESGYPAQHFIAVTLANADEPSFQALLGSALLATVRIGGRDIATVPLPPFSIWQEGDRCLARVGEALLTASPPLGPGGVPVPRGAPWPRQSPSHWIDPDSYPAAAMKAKQQGETDVAVDVDRFGYPTGCRVVRSAGAKALDEASCAQIMKRGRFFPALDGTGKAVPGVWERRVIWRL